MNRTHADRRKDTAFGLIEQKEHTNVKPKNTIYLWFDRDAEQGARFYAATFPDTRAQDTPLSGPIPESSAVALRFRRRWPACLYHSDRAA